MTHLRHKLDWNSAPQRFPLPWVRCAILSGEAWEALGSETPRIFHAARRRSSDMAAGRAAWRGVCPNAEELGAALAAIEMARPDGLLISNDALLLSSRSRLVEFARDRALPAVYGQREYVDAGGLMSYSTSIYDVWRRAGFVVNKLLKGS